MKRQHVVIKLGPEDRFAVNPRDPHATVSVVQAIDGFGSFEFGLDHLLGAARALHLAPPEVAFDLALIAVTIMGADTRVNRAIHAQDGWTRELFLYLPVADPKLWSVQAPRLNRMLNFLTGDRWSLQFRARPKKFGPVVTPPDQFDLSDFSCVSLLSGGLDSFIGALDLLSGKETPLFVSHYWYGITNHYQQAVLASLAAEYPKKGAFDEVRIHSGFGTKWIPAGGGENSQRSRSFLFFALAVFFASGMKRPTNVLVPENGLIALNVPLDPLRVGALSTRTAHPFYLARWNELLVELGVLTSLVNPYATRTKGTMVRRCKNQPALRKYLTRTMSCSSAEKARWKGLPPQHCGYCLPCLIRRAALREGLGDGDTTTYTQPLGKKLKATQKKGEHIRSFQVAIAELAANPAGAQFLIRKPGPLIDVTAEIDAYVKVYRDGMKEIENLLQGTKTVP